MMWLRPRPQRRLLDLTAASSGQAGTRGRGSGDRLRRLVIDQRIHQGEHIDEELGRQDFAAEEQTESVVQESLWG